MNDDISQMQQQINDLTIRLDTLNNNTTIPMQVGEAFKARLLGNLSFPKKSAKDPVSESSTVVATVDFVGSTVTTTPVLKEPDGYLSIVIAGLTYYFPFYT